jgi:UDP-N-acetylmuramate dehydrogenase
MIQENILLKNFTNYQIGGPARYFLEFDNLDSLKAGLIEWQKISVDFLSAEKKIFLLGGGTNILASDGGFPGLVLHNKIGQIESLGDGIYRFGSGLLVEELNNFAIQEALSGFEWSGGLPGTIGGAVFGNAGAFGGETKDSVHQVTCLDLESLEIKSFDNSSCHFGYRSSIFKEKYRNSLAIISVDLSFKRGDRDLIAAETEEKIAYRQSRQPLEYPNAGSTFKNVPVDTVAPWVAEEASAVIKTDPFPVIPAAYLINEVGLKGKEIGGAQISEKHPNFIINKGGAMASDVSALIELVQKTILDKYGIMMETEIIRL